jgi:hypothetical protein
MCLVDAASSGRPKHGSCALCVVAGGREEKRALCGVRLKCQKAAQPRWELGWACPCGNGFKLPLRKFPRSPLVSRVVRPWCYGRSGVRGKIRGAFQAVSGPESRCASCGCLPLRRREYSASGSSSCLSIVLLLARKMSGERCLAKDVWRNMSGETK